MTEELAALLENEDEDALFARIQEESLRHYREVELPRRALESKNEDDCNTSDIFVTPHNVSSTSDTDQLFYEGTEAGASGFHLAAGSSYIYPSNYPVRDYQANIVRSALFHNTLVSLPTGLGKTFIAAVVMYNYYRWFPRGKVVFMAPTRPLVSQQIRACHDIMAIPAEDTIEMTGTMNPNDRVQFWKTKRVFFLTPQILANDLRNKICPALEFKCVVVDEAHRATKEYAYCQVIRVLEEFGAVFRVLALSATPGSNFKAVQEVVENLHIAKLEIRDESSIDVAPYTYSKNIEPIIVKLTGQIVRIKEEFLSIFDRYVQNLKDARLVTGNVNSMTKFQLLKSSEKIKTHIPQGMTKQQVGYLMSDFAVSMSLAHALELLQTYGLQAFHHYLSSGDDDVKVKAAMARLRQDTQLQELLQSVEQYLSSENGRKGWSHPKLEHLVKVLQQHFSAAQDSGACSKVIIFCQYRVVVSEVYNILKTSLPLIRPAMFIGQSNGNGKGGLPQKKQLEVMRNFRNGETNVLIATCVAEEGLDIGAVDLIILMEAHRSPVRFVQRLGRTGRHRNGRCVVLLTNGKEVQKFNDAMAVRRLYTRNVLQNPNLFDSLNENDPRMLPSHLPNPNQQLVHIRVNDDTTAGGKYKKQGDIRQAFNKKSGNKKSAEPSIFLNSEQLAEIKSEYQTLEFNAVPVVSNKYLWQRLMDCPMGCDELFMTTYNKLSEFNDWNSSLYPTYTVSHSTDSYMFSELLQLANEIRDTDCTRTDVNTQFVRETVKNDNASKKRPKKNNKNSDGINKKKKQDKNAPPCSMDIRDCMAVASQKIKLSQDESCKGDSDVVVIDEPEVIDLVSEAIEIEDDILAYADKELYDDINKLHSLAQKNSVSGNIIDNSVLKNLSCLQTECPKFLRSFDFPDIEEDDIIQAKIKNLNIENMFKSCIDHNVFEEYEINTDELISKYEENSDNNDSFVFSCLNENIKKTVWTGEVINTALNKTKDIVKSTSSMCLEPKSECKMLSQKWNESMLKDSNECNKISINYSKNNSIRHEQMASQRPTIKHEKQEKHVKLTENVNNADDSLLPGVQKERITEVEKIKEESKQYFEGDEQIIDVDDISPVLSEKAGTKLKISKGYSQSNKKLLSPSLTCGTRKLEDDNSNSKNKHINGKQMYTKKGQVSPILTSGKKNMRKCKNIMEYSLSPILSNRISVQHNGNENDDNEHSASPILSSRISVNVKTQSSLPETRVQHNGLGSDAENSKSPILSGTTRYIKRQTSLKKNLFRNQNESGSHFVSTSCKTEDKLSTVNSSFVSNKSVSKHCEKSQYGAANKYSNKIQRSARSGQISSDLCKEGKTESMPVSNLTGACSSEIIGIDELFEDIDNNDDKYNKNIVNTGQELKGTEFKKTVQKSISCNAESESEFVFNFDDLFDDAIDSNFSLSTAANKGVQQASNINTNQITKPEKQSCTSPIIISKRINSQSTPRSSLINNSKLPVHSVSKKLPVFESGSETESDILESPIFKLMHGAGNAISRCSTPVGNLSTQFRSKKPGQSCKLAAQQQSFIGGGNAVVNTKQVEQVDYFQLDGGEDDNWSFSQLFDENKTDDDSMYTISQLVAKSSGLPTPKPSKQQEESVSKEVSSKLKEENMCPSKNNENSTVSCKTVDNIIEKELTVSEDKPNKNCENPVVNWHSNIFQFDSDDDLFEGIDSNVLSTLGATHENSTINQKSLNKVRSTHKFVKNDVSEQILRTKVPECKYDSFNGCVKKNGLSESLGLSNKENIYNDKENINSRTSVCFSNSKTNKTLPVLNTSKMGAKYNSSKLDNGFSNDNIIFKNFDNFNSLIGIKSPLKSNYIMRNYKNACGKNPVLSSGWLTTKNVSELKRARPDDFTSDDSDTGSVFVSIHKNGINEHSARNVKKKIKKHPVDKNVIINIANEFVEREAEVSINRVLSSDEENTSGLDDLDESFIDDLTQRLTTAADQSSVNMHAKYLQSVKSPARGRFKIPVLSDTALQIDVYSQMVEEDGSYINDSFCVDETEIAHEAEPSVLEIAEQILEDRRKQKKKRKRVRTYSSTSNSECDEDVHLKNGVKKNESACSDEHSLVINRRRKRRAPTVLSESESDAEIVNHKHSVNNSDSVCKNTSEHSKISGEVSNSSLESKSGELFYKPTLSKLLKSKLKR